MPKQPLPERHSIALRAAGMGVWEWDIVNDKLVWDDFLFELNGTPRENFSGKLDTWTAVLHPETREATMNELAGLLRNSRDFRSSYRVLRRTDGREIHVTSAGRIERDSAGNPLYMIGVSWDCTPEELLKLENSRTRDFVDGILNAIGDPIFVKDPDHRWIFLNQAFTDLIGTPKEQMLGKSDYDFFSKELADHYWRVDNEVFRLRKEIEVEESVVNSSGETRIILTKKTPSVTADGGEGMLVGVIRDITERKQAEQELRNLQQLVESSNDFYAAFDLSFRAVYANRAAVSFCGLKPGITAMRDIFSPEHRAQLEDEILQRARHGAYWAGELALLSSSEGSIPVSASIFGILGPEGKVATIALIAKDIRSQINSQRAMMEQAKMAALGQLAGGIAHEINNPLAAVRGRLYIMKMGLESVKKIGKKALLKEVETVDRLTMRISEIVNALKVFSHKDPSTVLKKLSLLDVVNEVASVSMDKLRSTACTLEISVPPGLEVLGRRVDLMQILVNLINNSSYAVATCEEKWVKIEASAQNGEVHLRVSDSGAGIPEHVAKRMMDPFYTTKDVGQGTGLGLSISRSLAENMSGSLEYDREAKNTTFVLKLQGA